AGRLGIWADDSAAHLVAYRFPRPKDGDKRTLSLFSVTDFTAGRPVSEFPVYLRQSGQSLSSVRLFNPSQSAVPDCKLTKLGLNSTRYHLFGRPGDLELFGTECPAPPSNLGVGDLPPARIAVAGTRDNGSHRQLELAPLLCRERSWTRGSHAPDARSRSPERD